MKKTHTLCRPLAITYSRVLAIAVVIAFIFLSQTQATSSQASWRNDPAWHSGKAEWALYEAQRVVYGKTRNYEATIFTNKQHMDPKTTTKAMNWHDPDSIEVFKHNISEIFPTENYPYRMLTTSFIRTDNFQPYKLTASSQEDCGSSFRNFITTQENQLKVDQFCYFPDTGHSQQTIDTSKGIAFHNALSLTLRDFPFGVIFIKQPELNLIPDQRKNTKTKTSPVKATITDLGEEEITVPYGKLNTHHLRIDHAEDGGETESHFWFAADPKLLNVMVQYQGPYGINYKLKNHGWWAYWDRSNKKPD
ncbi:MAG: hypothetical protein IH984_14250 [Planctomycetes bacterium]|nr:hypothetical protein [Planctomycetota bacterium]